VCVCVCVCVCVSNQVKRQEEEKKGKRGKEGEEEEGKKTDQGCKQDLLSRGQCSKDRIVCEFESLLKIVRVRN